MAGGEKEDAGGGGKAEGWAESGVDDRCACLANDEDGGALVEINFNILTRRRRKNGKGVNLMEEAT